MATVSKGSKISKKTPKLFLPVEKIVYVHIVKPMSTKMLRELMKQIKNKFGKDERNKLGFVEFWISSSLLITISDLLQTIQFDKFCKYFLHEIKD
ncbi:hypothetical protein [Mycoplasma amphoriforme]|uniref:hypothetical protein n=1 Tax=Mycoplasma amphoriforme TaxID=273136 RepID=UPI0031BB91DD